MSILTLIKTALRPLVLEFIRWLSLIGLSLVIKLQYFLTTVIQLTAEMAFQYFEEKIT